MLAKREELLLEKRQKEIIKDKKESALKVSSKIHEKEKKQQKKLHGTRGQSDDEEGLLLEKT